MWEERGSLLRQFKREHRGSCYQTEIHLGGQALYIRRLCHLRKEEDSAHSIEKQRRALRAASEEMGPRPAATCRWQGFSITPVSLDRYEPCLYFMADRHRESPPAGRNSRVQSKESQQGSRQAGRRAVGEGHEENGQGGGQVGEHGEEERSLQRGGLGVVGRGMIRDDKE